MKKGILTAISSLLLAIALGAGVGVSTPRLLTSAGEVAGMEKSIEEGNEPTVPIRGDLNGDGEVSSADLAYMRRYLAGWQGYTVENQNKFDLDGDGQITGSDVAMMRRYLAEWEVHPEEAYTDGLTFEKNTDGISYSVTGYHGAETESLVIPSYYHGLPVTEIAEGALNSVTNAISLTIGDNITGLTHAMLSSFTHLTSLTVGAGVTSIDIEIFIHIEVIVNVVVSGNNNKYSTQDGVLFDKEKTELIAYPQGKADESYKIPETVTTIGDNAFAGNRNLKKVTMSDGVENIGENAFANTAIKDIRLPNNENLTTAETSFTNTTFINIYFTGSQEDWTSITVHIHITITITVTIYYEVPEEENPEHTHSYEETEKVSATCGADGYIRYTCSDCGMYYIEKTIATGAHTGGTATCQHKAVCSVCGMEYGVLADHQGELIWMKHLDSHYRVYSCCYSQATAAEGHTKVDGVCTVCGYSPAIIVSSAEAVPGEQVEIALSLVDNPGIAGLMVSVQYSDVLELTNAESGEALDLLKFTKPTTLGNGCKFLWDGETVNDKDIKDGEFLTLTFSVSASAPVGDYRILINVKAYDNNLNLLMLTISNGTITIEH